jgi:hypothetical protein
VGAIADKAPPWSATSCRRFVIAERRILDTKASYNKAVTKAPHSREAPLPILFYFSSSFLPAFRLSKFMIALNTRK